MKLYPLHAAVKVGMILLDQGVLLNIRTHAHLGGAAIAGDQIDAHGLVGLNLHALGGPLGPQQVGRHVKLHGILHERQPASAQLHAATLVMQAAHHGSYRADMYLVHCDYGHDELVSEPADTPAALHDNAQQTQADWHHKAICTAQTVTMAHALAKKKKRVRDHVTAVSADLEEYVVGWCQRKVVGVEHGIWHMECIHLDALPLLIKLSNLNLQTPRQEAA